MSRNLSRTLIIILSFGVYGIHQKAESNFGTALLYGAAGVPGVSSQGIRALLSIEIPTVAPPLDFYWSQTRYQLSFFPSGQRSENEKWNVYSRVEKVPGGILKNFPKLTRGLHRKIFRLAQDSGFGNFDAIRMALYNGLTRIPRVISVLTGEEGPLRTGHWGAPFQSNYHPDGVENYRFGMSSEGKLPHRVGKNFVVPLAAQYRGKGKGVDFKVQEPVSGANPKPADQAY